MSCNLIQDEEKNRNKSFQRVSPPGEIPSWRAGNSFQINPQPFDINFISNKPTMAKAPEAIVEKPKA